MDGAKKRLVSSLAKRNLVEHVVPSVIELKRMLEAEQSPLLGDLMAATRFLLKDYKTELEDILIADKQMARELLYDLHREEEGLRDGVTGGQDTVGAQVRAITLSAGISTDNVATAEKLVAKSQMGTHRTPSKLCVPADGNPSRKRGMSKVQKGSDRSGGKDVLSTPRGTSNRDSQQKEFAGVDSIATPTAAAVLASAAENSGSRQKSPFAAFCLTADLTCSRENLPLSAPRLRVGSTPSRTSSSVDVSLTPVNPVEPLQRTVSLQNPNNIEPDVRQWNMKPPEPEALDNRTTVKTNMQTLPVKDVCHTRKGRGQKRKA